VLLDETRPRRVRRLMRLLADELLRLRLRRCSFRPRLRRRVGEEDPLARDLLGEMLPADRREYRPRGLRPRRLRLPAELLFSRWRHRSPGSLLVRERCGGRRLAASFMRAGNLASMRKYAADFLSLNVYDGLRSQSQATGNTSLKEDAMAGFNN